MGELIHNRTNYKDLICYQKAECVYDITYWFCHNYLNAGDRTIDQMIQAARSGKQNIAEGYAASSTSAESGIKLLNVARASLVELIADYEDFIRTRRLRQWESTSEEVAYVRKIGKQHSDSAFFLEILAQRNEEVAANMAIVLIHQADFVLHKLLLTIEQKFLNEGGFKEQMYAQRVKSRGK